MKTYYIDDFKNKDVYDNFIRYMLSHSDAFSFVYFKYRNGEPTKKTTADIKKLLLPYKMYAENVSKWPSTVTLNEFNHIYRLVMYKSVPQAEIALTKVDAIYDWDYPKYPMDLCFYRDGYAWFATSSHECWNALYTNDISIIEELKTLGVSIFRDDDTDDENLFYDKRTII